MTRCYKLREERRARMKIFFENNFQPLKIGFIGRVYKK